MRGMSCTIGIWFRHAMFFTMNVYALRMLYCYFYKIKIVYICLHPAPDQTRDCNAGRPTLHVTSHALVSRNG